MKRISGRCSSKIGQGALIILAGGLSSCEGGPGERLRLRVMSYNIRHGEGTDGRIDLERIAGVIRSQAPDLVALQEVDRATTRSGGVDQAAELGRLTGMEAVFAASIEFAGGEYGNAILSRLPVEGRRVHLLPSFDDGEQRSALAVEIRLPSAEGSEAAAGRLLFLSTHLDHRIDGRERIASARTINALALAEPDRPVVLAGDLNDVLDGPAFALFEEAWWNPAPEELPTIPAGEPRRQIDFVLARPAGRWRARSVRAIAEPVASDHRPLVADLELLPE